MIKSSLTFWQSHRGVHQSQSSNGLSQTWNKHAEKTPDQSQSWSRFGRLNLFAKMNEKLWGNIVCKTGTILDVSEQGTFSQSRKDAHQMKRPIWGSWSMWRWLSKEEGHKAMNLLSFCWTVDDSHLAFVGVYDSWCHIITYWHQMVVSPSNSW